MRGSARLYSILLRLLPRGRRKSHGDEMRRVFVELQTTARQDRGVAGVIGLWIAEIAGVLRFAIRERFGIAELGWAWRGVRRRGWTAALSVVLLALAVAANAVVFSVADSLVFHRLTYREPARLVEIQQRNSPFLGGMSPNLLEQWQANRDILEGITGYLSKFIFLEGAGAADKVATADVMPGTFELLGAHPRWGRSFSKDDAFSPDADIAVISETLARARFVDPALAVGRRIETTGFPLQIVGVMPATFRFPTGAVEVWRALDPRGDLARNHSLSNIARLAPGVTRENAEAMVRQRSAVVAAAAGVRGPYVGTLAAVEEAQVPADLRRLFVVLFAAAACLLLIACANVASLELASAVSHARTYGIQLALGASRGTLARVALLEAAFLNMGALALALWLTSLGTSALANDLPNRLGASAVNPIDVDARTVLFMTVVTLACCMLSSLPAVVYASRASVLSLIKLDARIQSGSSGGVALRRMLTIIQVALVVLLLLGSVFFTRSYVAMLHVDKGFDSQALISVDFTVPPQMLSQVLVVRQDLLGRLKTVPGVLAVMAEEPPNQLDSTSRIVNFDMDGNTIHDADVRLGQKPVSPDYFRLLGIPLRAGRMFDPNEPVTHAIVDERFARAFWPGGAIGHTFRGGIARRMYEIVGVVGHVRSDGVRQSDSQWSTFVFYVPASQSLDLDEATAAPAPRTRVTFASYGFILLTLKLDSPSRAEDVFRTARAMAPQFKMDGKRIDDVYTSYEDDTLLVTRIVSAFGLFAFVVAMAGVYGVMAFIVSGRRREIGIRMALGAGRGEVSRLVLVSSLRLTLAGAGLGIVCALGVSHWVKTQLFGITPTDPASYVLVTVVIVATALVATWHPAHSASRVDPVVTLRAE